jgi:hypothetical protein
MSDKIVEIEVTDDLGLDVVCARLVMAVQGDSDVAVAKTQYEGHTLRAWRGESILKVYTNAEATLGR